MAAAMESHITLARTLDPKLLRFFKRFPPPALRGISQAPPSPPETVQIAENTSSMDPNEGAASITLPLDTPQAPQPTHNDARKHNPFLPFKNPNTGNWHSPHYSLRRQAVLFKLAQQHNVLPLMPLSPKHPEVKAEKILEQGLRVKGTGVGQKVKGKLWERTLSGRLEARRKAMEGMPEMIRQWKERGHGRGWKKFPRKSEDSTINATAGAENSVRVRGKYTPEEDATITKLRARGVDWPGIQRALPHRTTKSLNSRWRQNLCPSEEGVKRSTGLAFKHFDQAEDAVIADLRSQRKGWPKIQHALSHRSRDSLRKRWSRYIMPRLDIQNPGGSLRDGRLVSDYNHEEDAKILRLRRQGMQWRKIAEHFPSRFLHSLKSRFRNLKLGQAFQPALNPGLAASTPSWTAEDSNRLLRLRDEDRTDWSDIVHHFPTRRHGNIESHYRKLRNLPPKDMRRYSATESSTLMRLRGKGESWAQIASYCSGRSVRSLMNHYRYKLDVEMYRVECEEEAAKASG